MDEAYPMTHRGKVAEELAESRLYLEQETTQRGERNYDFLTQTHLTESPTYEDQPESNKVHA